MSRRTKYDAVKAKADAAERLAKQRQSEALRAAGRKLPRVRIKVDMLEESIEEDEPEVIVTPATVTKKKPGPEPKYNKTMCVVAANLVKAGTGYYELAEILGISYSTMWRYSNYHSELRKALDTPVDPESERLKNRQVKEALFRSAVGHNGIPANAGACRVWLRNRMKEEFPDGHVLTGPNGGPIQQQFVDLDPEKVDNLSPQEMLVFENVMRKMQKGPSKTEPAFQSMESKEEASKRDKDKAAKYAKSLH